METGAGREQSRRVIWLIVAAVLLLRLPFLHQAIQGDDVYYLAEAEHAQVEPLHPKHFQYVFLGTSVDMRGHPHPPLNGWALGGLLAALGDIREVPFHLAYTVFSIIAALSMWSLAKRFSPDPLGATLLFLAVPAFVINGNSFEADLPFLAFWMASIALFVSGRYAFAVLAMALAALGAYQAIFLTPILWAYTWLRDRHNRKTYLLALTAPAVLIAWQIFERTTTGAFPAAVLTGYFKDYKLQQLTSKLASGLMLTIHACWMVPLPLLFRRLKDPFLKAWIAIFYLGALAIFFAGSARYLLPIAAPLAIWASYAPRRWVRIGFVLQIVLSLGLAWANYDHWDAYRTFAAGLRDKTQPGKLWINADWGLRYYLQSDGGLPLLQSQAVRPGDVVVTSELSFPVAFTTGGGILVPLAQTEVTSTVPLRLFALNSHSGYSSVDKGFLPFGISTSPIDRVTAVRVVEAQPTLTLLPMNAPEATQQIVSGLYAQEGNWRWSAATAVVLLKSPATPEPLQATFHIHPNAPARTVRLLLDGKEVAIQTYPAPGTYTLKSPPLKPTSSTATVSLSVDKTFRAPGDNRNLGVIVTQIGFAPSPP